MSALGESYTKWCSEGRLDVLTLSHVRTDRPILRDKLNEAMKVIAEKKIKAPVKMGQVLIKNILGTDISIIASRDLAKI